MMNTFTHISTGREVKVVALKCYTIEEQDDVVITDAEIIDDYCKAQMGDEYDFMGFQERLYQKGYELETPVVEETA